MLPPPIQEVTCSHCGTLNRIRPYGINELPRCGKCSAGLPEPLGKRLIRLLYVLRGDIVVVAAMMAVTAVAIFKPTIVSELLPGDPQTKTQTPVVDPCAAFPQPSSGLYAIHDVSERVAPLTIKTRVGESYFIKLQDAITSRPIMAFYLEGGETLAQRVPEGTFVIKYATGKTWCGERNLFGRDTSFSQADKVFQFTEESGYTITLIPLKHGNLRTRAIDRSQF